ncbi:MAG: hypothetical protein ABJB74_09365 [Gemmatimonas sp.]
MSMRPFSSAVVCVMMLAVVVTCTNDLCAQSLKPGTRVRVVSATGVSLNTGKFVRATSDSLWMSSSRGKDPLGLPLNQNVSIERSLGRSHRLRHGALGATVGIVVASILVSAVATETCGEIHCDFAGNTGPLVAAVSIPLIVLPLGAFIGVKTARERWEPIARSPNTGLSPFGKDRLRVGATIAF